MRKVVEVHNETGLKKMDLLLELDFAPDSSGTAPALRHPPEFSVKETRGYYEGSRPNEPDWFYKGHKEVYKKNIKASTDALKDHHGRMTEDHLLCLVRHAGGFTSCYRVQLMTEASGPQMLGDEAFRAFRVAINDDDYGPMASLFPAQVSGIRHRLGGTPSQAEQDEIVDRVRMMLNAMGGNFPTSGRQY